MINRIELILVVLVLALASTAWAIDFEGMYCESDLDCLELSSSTGMEVYCNLETSNCAYDETSDAATDTTAADSTIDVAETPDTTASETAASSSELQLLLTSVQNQINFLESTTNNLQQQLNTLNANLQAINTKLSEMNQVKTEVNSVAVGLAGLQTGLNKTSTELGTLQDSLDKRFTRNKILIAVFLVLLAISAALGVMYYLNRKGQPIGGTVKEIGPQINLQIANYITKQLKAGKKYQEIKNLLLKAGWQEQDIQWAYKETVRSNYQNYLQQKNGQRMQTTAAKISSGAGASKRSTGADKNKIIGIAVITLLLLGGILLLLRGTTGQAVYFQKLVGGKEGGETGEITYDVQCTPPHLLNPSKDGCCLDLDNNGECDYLAQKEGGPAVGEGAACTDNSQCEQGTLCLDGRCEMLSSIYTKQVCERSCNFYGVKIKVIYSTPTERKTQKTCVKDNQCDDHISETTDECQVTKSGSFCIYRPLVEEYILKPKQGSYSTVGATEWKILESPDYCEGEQAVVPIKIIHKKGKEILSESIITLKERETSEDIKHPLYESVSFKLKVDKISRPVGC